jgi:SAM-dependent methyltransferase
MPARHLRIQLATIGVRGMARLTWQNRTHARLRAYEVCQPLVERRRGLEIGGPSAIFARTGALPLYPLFDQLDNCDFAGETVWHGAAADGTEFTYDDDRPPGRRFIRDATSLDGFDNASYDVVLASHTLEHIANPLLALSEWKRVVGSDGHLVLALPHLENTFDHRRPVTTLEHIEADFATSTCEDDPTHITEFIELCDLSRVPEPLSRQAFEERTRDHTANRTVHHHVFDTELAVRLLDRAGYQLLWVETALPFHIVVVARADGPDADNGDFLAPTAAWRRASVFRRDRA